MGARILRILHRRARPMSAYALLGELRRENPLNLYPQTIYRALGDLIEKGFVHKLSSVNAFLACTHPRGTHEGIHLICDDCGMATELVDARVDALLNRKAGALAFKTQYRAVELHGVCGKCSQA
ncbi:MAG TPA: Fur family transcriptional regulator [Nevskiaceae bacterium]|nr:Fur family transcriptional regulator [Nevskiaceae bacterium]